MVKVLKIGGSILTDKKRKAWANHDEIRRVAEEIAAFPEELVLVHGAGSFGHVLAEKYRLQERFDPRGIQLTHQTVVKLNELVIKALCEAGAKPMPVHPFSCTLLRNGRIEDFDLKPVAEMIRRELIPVLHGDIAMDVACGSGIVSGDQLVSYLAKAVMAEVVAIGTNVDGVIFQGKVLPTVTKDDLQSIEAALDGSSGVDVTGGMKGKLQELLELANAGIESFIFNASRQGQIIKVLRGERVGTIIRRPV